MAVKIIGVDSRAVTALHEKVNALKPGESYSDTEAGNSPIDLVRIISCKLDPTYRTYTIELMVMVKCANAMMVREHGEGRAHFGEYFAPVTALTDLFPALSLGQQAPLFPEKEFLAEDKK